MSGVRASRVARSVCGLVAFLGLLAAAACLGPRYAPRPQVHVSHGTLEGRWNGAVAVFRGIPFAAAPLGEARWRPPAAPETWSGVRDASDYGPRCPQTDRMRENVERFLVLQGVGPIRRWMVRRLVGLSDLPPIDEDCLYLNVQTTNLDGDAPQPVMVWIHGGGHQNGAGSQAPYGSHFLVDRGVVQITINYRLGPFGFLAHPALSAESPQAASGNYGLLDQIAALRWVRENAAAFGGDPGNVTLFGESAGAHSIGQLMTSPMARGLFHKAIAQSGSGVPVVLHLRRPFPGVASAEDEGLALARRLGVEGEGPAAAAALRAFDVSTLLASTTGRPFDERGLHPNVDGWVLPRAPANVFAAAEQARVPVLAGFNADEATVLYPELEGAARTPVFEVPGPIESVESYRRAIEVVFAEDAARVLALYPAETDEQVPRASERLWTDAYFGVGARALVAAASKRGVPAWLYLFTRTGPGEAGRLGAYHGADVAFVFGSVGGPLPHNDYDRALSDSIGDYWVQFARTGDPNGEGRPVWPRYDPAAAEWLELGRSIDARPVSRAEAFDLFDRRLARLLPD